MQRSSLHQLRIYQINPKLKNEFDIRFRDHASRIMHKHGFEIVAMWYAESVEGLEFIYILRWPDEATKEKKWATFMSDNEWDKIKHESREKHGEMVLAKVRDQIISETDWFQNKIT